MNKDEALKLALEALENGKRVRNAEGGTEYQPTLEDKAIAAIKEALAQPEQEPVAWMTINAYGEEDDIHYECPEGHLLEGWTYKPLYTNPPTVQPEKEPLEYWNAVEGWVKIDEVHEHFNSVGCGTIYKTSGEDRVPLYTTPPYRKWVGLTDDELVQIGVATGLERAAVEMISNKLKEKNG
tara:strand:+ start:311 stop:853 length:543 start_codon:yes stop_codon:yes gene_type:complete